MPCEVPCEAALPAAQAQVSMTTMAAMLRRI
jgi:hypothetical protein